MNKAMEITVKRQSGIFSLVVYVEEDGKFYKVKKVTFDTTRHTLVAGIIRDGKIAFGMRYYLDNLSRDNGQELYSGRVGETCEAVISVLECVYERDIGIEVKEVDQYVPQSNETMFFEEADLQERSYLISAMLAAENSFNNIN